MIFNNDNAQITKGIRCPFCSSISAHSAHLFPIHIFPESIELEDGQIFFSYNVVHAKCHSCTEESIWLKKGIRGTTAFVENIETYCFEKILYPITNVDIPKPNIDMPDDIKTVYLEASNVINDSPRASAALSRLAIQMLVDILIDDDLDLNKKIGKLVEKGLPIEIQQMLDSVRVIGNNAVHPGQIDIKDNYELAKTLLNFINLIIDNRISQPQKIQEIYSSLPKSSLQGIENRDKSKT